jgi:hypothetical protein
LVAGDRRIYTVWEKVQCTSPSTRLTISTGPVKVKKYESCGGAIRFEVYKFVQQALLRKICDWMAFTNGAKNFSEVTWMQFVLFKNGREQIVISVALNFPKIINQDICAFSRNVDDSIFVVFSGKNDDSIRPQVQILNH